MAKKKKTNEKLTLKSIANIMPREEDCLKVVSLENDENKIDIIVKPRLSLNEISEFTNDVISLVKFDDIDGNFNIFPQYIDYAIGYSTILHFTNIDIKDDEMEEACQLIYNSSLLSRVVEAIGEDYYSCLVRRVYESIEIEKSIIAKKSKLDGILTALLRVVDALKSKFDEMTPEQVEEFVTRIEDISKADGKEKKEISAEVKNDNAE